MGTLKHLLVPLALLMLCMQVDCSGGVGPPRPYLFRDFGMPTSGGGGYAQVAHFYQPKNREEPQQDEYEFGGSSSEEEQPQYTEPLILDIDDPDKARWIAEQFQRDDSEEEEDEEYDDENESGRRRLSSTEFRSRSSVEVGGEENKRKFKSDDDDDNNDDGSSPSSGESRGILNFKILNNPLLSLWKNDDDNSEQPAAHDEDEPPQADEGTYFYSQPYDYDPYGIYPQSDQKSPEMMPMSAPPKPKQKPTPKPKRKPKPKPKPQPKRRPRPQPQRPHPQSRPGMMQKPKIPNYEAQYHYQHQPLSEKKPGKLTSFGEKIHDKLASLNPLRLMLPSKKKPKRPPHPPRKGAKPHEGGDEDDEKKKPEFVMFFGEPFGEISADDVKSIDGRSEEEEEEANDDDDDDDDDEEDNPDEDGDDGDEDGGDDVKEDDEEEPEIEMNDNAYYNEPNAGEGEYVSPVTYQDTYGNEDNQPVKIQDYPSEDDEAGAYEALSTKVVANPATRSSTATKNTKEKSFLPGFGWRRRRKHKPKPARRPPNWKEYEAGPLIPEVVGDTILKIVKNVGILPEYEKDEKYGGHHKIKGKFTKTRPITLHHGLLTEVLRR